jgi:hypothetical protein
MSDFKTVVDKAVWKMIKKYDTCIQPHYNGLDDAQVVFMEAGCFNMPNIHACMKEFHALLTDMLGYPPCMSHNHPTDNIVQVLADPINGEVFYSDECCKRLTIECYKRYVDSNRKGYSDYYRSIFKAAECIADSLDKTPEYVLETLDWNRDPQAQLIQHLINFHC